MIRLPDDAYIIKVKYLRRVRKCAIESFLHNPGMKNRAFFFTKALNHIEGRVTHGYSYMFRKKYCGSTLGRAKVGSIRRSNCALCILRHKEINDADSGPIKWSLNVLYTRISIY